MTTDAIVISGTGLFTPSESISNDELVKALNTYVETYNAENADAITAGDLVEKMGSNAEFIQKASGIKSRYVMNKSGILDPARMAPDLPERGNDEPSVQCEMAVASAKEALKEANKTAADIDMVIVACSNLQRAYPAMAIEVQEALGIDGFAYDMNVACSSATFGISSAYNAIVANNAKTVLMVNPEICAGHLEFKDRDCHFIFGDACTAVIVERASNATSDQQFEILGSKLQTKFSNNIRNNFGFLNRADESGVGSRDKLFVQEGRKVFKEVVPMVATQIADHLSELSIPVEAVKRLWLHQANLSMNQLIAKKLLGRPAEDAEAPVILDTYANTSSAGSVIAFHGHKEDLSSGDTGVICSFGAGYSVGSVVLRKI